MPSKEDIERFTQVLNSLGNEPAIRAARSETIDEVPAPGEETSTADAGPLDSLGPEAAESESLQDIFESLSALPEEETAEEPSAPEPAGEPVVQGAADEGLDFSSLFGEEAAPEGIEELEKPGLTEEDSFALPEGEAGSLEADLSQMETLPEEEVQREPGVGAEPEAPVAGSESFDLPDLGDLSFSEPSEEPAAPASSTDALDEPMPSLDEPALFDAPVPALDEPASVDEPMPSLDAPTSLEEPLSSLEEPLSSLEEPLSSLEEPLSSLEEPALDQAAVSGFDLDTATLAGQAAGSEGDQLPAEMPEEPAQIMGAEMESLGEESLEDLNLDQFSLLASAEEFGATGAPAPEPKPRPAAPPRQRPAERKPQRPQPRAAVASSETAGETEIELTPEQFAHLKRALESLPRNLKIVVQDLIGQGTATGPDLAALLTLLLRGASAQEIATLAGRISGKRIRIPAGYEKKTGLAFEAEQRTFAYAFRENFLPLLRVVAITVIAGGLFGFLGYNYVFRPLSAYSNYRAGYAQIANDRFTLANERFARATSIWPLKRWYYSYAEAFAAKRQYLLAEHKYDDLLTAYPGDRKGTLDYARMESERLADYEKADSLLAQFLDAHHDDYDGLLAQGDNDLLWAQRDGTKLERARLAYATLIDKFGARDVLLFRMLRYFIRSDNGEEVERLRAFYATKPDVKIDAPVFAEMGGYLIDHRRLDWAQETLLRADKTQPGLYEVHYNLARYYRIVKNVADEKKALEVTVKILDLTKDTDAVTRRRLSVEIDTHTRLGEYYFAAREYLPSEKDLQTAIRLIENNQRMKLIDANRLFGRPYAVLGDLYYTIQGDLQSAAQQYRKAIENGYTDPELTYKIGCIQYAQRDFKGALDSFTSAEDASAYPTGNEALAPAAEIVAQTASQALPLPPGQPPQNLLYSLGTTFYQRGDYFAAQGYYLRMLERLESRRAALGILHPEDRSDDRALLDTLVKVNNNLGVTMFRLAERTGDRKKRSEAMVYLSAGAEIAGSLARSPDTVRRSEDRSLPSLNMHAILYPVSGFVLQTFTLLPKDYQAVDW
jgi:Tfp pilus assembly protein PilF